MEFAIRNLKSSVKSLFHSIKIAKLKRWEILFENFNHLEYSHPLASSHLLQIKVGINIKVSHLDEIEASPPNQFYPSFYFCLPVGKPREDEKIDRGIDSRPFGPDQRIHYLPKSKSFGAMIEIEVFRVGTVKCHSYAVKPCIT